MENAAIRSLTEAAIARRKDEFALSHLAWTAAGHTVRFRQGIVDLVRTVERRVFEDPARLDELLDGVRLTFQALTASD
jgi:hypothetical protein